MNEEDLKATKIQVQVLEEILSYKDKEIERLKEENTILKQTMSNNSLLINENAFLKERIDKAIKYIEERSHNSYFAMLQADYNMSLDELLDILRGKDNE